MSWGVAIAVRTPTIPAMLDWCDTRVPLSYDTRVGRYYRDVLNQYTFHTWPSLVDHRDGPSLVGHGRGRSAHRVHAGSALELDWSGPVVNDALHIQQRSRRGLVRPPRPIVRAG
jgi:hypothetical protein